MTNRERTRTELLSAISKLSWLRPDWRSGQTLANVVMTTGRVESGGAWDREDEEALAAA